MTEYHNLYVAKSISSKNVKFTLCDPYQTLSSEKAVININSGDTLNCEISNKLLSEATSNFTIQ